jgi:hypothetical protein
MTHVELNERVAWLERKMVRLLWLAISGVSMFGGYIAANIIDPDKGVFWGAVFLGVWVISGFILQRLEFKAAPNHIQFIDP